MAAVAMTLMMASCSGDDSESTENPSGNGPLLTKMVETYDGETYTINFHYNGNKLSHYIAGDGFETEFTYSGDKITKIEGFDNGDLVNENIYEYHSNGKLAKHIEIDYYDGDAHGTKTLFTHNDNGTISVQFFTGDDTAQTTESGTATVNIVNGNIESVAVVSEDGDEWERTYTYDNKHNPFRNVTSVETLVLSDLEGGINNILSENDTEWGDEMTSTYTYNSEGYPVTSSDTWNGDSDGDYQYFYN